MTRVGSYISPTHHVAKAAALQRNAAHGWTMQPGASSIEEGFILRNENDDAPDLYIPPLPGPAIRTTPCPLRMWPFYTVLGGTASLAAIAAVLAK